VDSPTLSQTSDIRLITWYDDCLDTSDWIEENATTEYQSDAVVSGTGGLSSDSFSFTVPEIPVANNSEYGPLFIKTLPTPIALTSILEFKVSMHFEYASNELGSLKVYLYDENKTIISSSEIVDEGVEVGEGANVRFRYHPLYYSSWQRTIESYYTSWFGYVSSWFDDIQNEPYVLFDSGFGNPEKFLVNNGFYDYDREACSIGLQWVRSNTENYNGTHLVLHGLSLIYRTELPPIKSWVHDCSNISGFHQYTNWTPSWLPDRVTSSDELVSDGDSLFLPTISSLESEWSGPIYLHELSAPLSFEDVVRFYVDFEFLFIDNNEEVKFEVYLLDQNLFPLLRFFYLQYGFMNLGYNIGLQVFHEGFTTIDMTPNQLLMQQFADRFTILISNPDGIFGDIPHSDRHFLSSWHLFISSNVSYVAILPSINEAEATIPVRVSNIHLDYEVGSEPTMTTSITTNPAPSTTTNPTTSVTTTPTNSFTPELLSPLTLVIWGISIASIFVIVVFTIKTIQHRRERS
jgi:hypothetical protein